MRKIRIICVGKNQDVYLKEGIKSFEQKLRRFCDLSWVFTKEAGYNRNEKAHWLNEEATRLENSLKPESFLIACDEKGKSLSSVEFANLFQTAANSGHSQFDFVIGGAFGLSSAIKQKADVVLSLSPMTFTHQMVRLLLIEQVYRAFTIINNIKYHHD